MSRRTLDELLAARAGLSDELADPVRRTADVLGVALDSIAVRDVWSRRSCDA